MIPTVLAKFRARYPTVLLRLDVGNTEAVLASVSSGRVPIGLVVGHARASGIRLGPFVVDEIVPVGGVGGRLRVRSVSDLATVPILWREAGSGTRAVLDRALRRAGVRRKPLDIELGSTEAILGAVAAGLGVGFVSRWSLQAHLAAGRIAVIAGLDLVVRRTFHFALPSGGLHGVAARFHEFAGEHPPTIT